MRTVVGDASSAWACVASNIRSNVYGGDVGNCSIAAKLMSRPLPPPEKYMQYVFAVSALALLVPVWFHGGEVAKSEVAGISFDGKCQLMGFILFEICVGIFWPSLMSVRSRFVLLFGTRSG